MTAATVTSAAPATLTPAEAAEWLGVGVHVVRELVANGHLVTVPNLPGRRVALAELERFVALGVSAASTPRAELVALDIAGGQADELDDVDDPTSAVGEFGP